MTNPKDILVTTTSSLEGLTVKQYLKPVSAHIVAGTNLFSDFLAGLTDVFGGRSHTYQKQLTSLYNEATERLKVAAFEIGANCIIGLQIDMNEISGRGKQMFMLTAIGTAAIIDNLQTNQTIAISEEKFENVGIDKIRILKQKREIIYKANSGSLPLEEKVWDFIIANQVVETYDFIISKLRQCFTNSGTVHDLFQEYYKKTVTYIDGLPENKKIELLYNSILNESNEQLANKLCDIVEELQLLDFEYINLILNSDDFNKQKTALRLLQTDKPFYNKQDIKEIESIIKFVQTHFVERGIRSMKKQLLSSKEKEIWTCECKSTNDMGYYCSNCGKDIFGFKNGESKPNETILKLEERNSLIGEYL